MKMRRKIFAMLLVSIMLSGCLGQNENVNLREVLRKDGINSLEKYLLSAILKKPKGHDFNIFKNGENVSIKRYMSHTGG